MQNDLIYLDNHATTRVDPEVLAAMLPYLQESYANPGSVNHAFGRSIADHIEIARQSIAGSLGAESEEIVFTSGATESNNLAIFGTCLHPRQRRRRVVFLTTEHRAVLDPMSRLERHGFEMVRFPVIQKGSPQQGCVDLDRLAESIDERVALVSIMLANNEIGVIQDLASIAKICAPYQCPLHTDATQAVGRLPIRLDELDVDMMSFSAHKFYGPKGMGGLFVRHRRVRLDPQVLGGGHQSNRRSGTLNVPGIVGMAKGLELSVLRGSAESEQCRKLRDTLWNLLQERIPDLQLNGPPLDSLETRLPHNLNCQFPGVEGQTLMMMAESIACSSGSACTSSNPEPSHVLLGIGCSEDQARSSLRFGIGRFNTIREIEQAASILGDAYGRAKRA